MKKMYAIYDKIIYELTDPATNDFDVITIGRANDSLKNQMRIEESERTSEVRVKLHLGLIHEDFKTNEEVAKDALNYAKNIKLKKCLGLDPNFTIELYYHLIDSKTKEICDEGVLIKHDNNPSSHNKFRILGATNNNKLHYRVVKNLTSNFAINYINDTPCGIMRKKSTSYILEIEKIKIYQDFYNDDHRCLNDRIKLQHKCSEGVAIPHSANHYHGHHDNKLCIFNSRVEGFKFSPIFIDMNLRRISIDLDLILNNYFILYDDNELVKILLENNQYFEESKPPCGCKPPESELPEFKDPLDRQIDEPQVITWDNKLCFFANGTPISIIERNDGEEGAIICWKNGRLSVDNNAVIFGGRHDDETLTNTNIQVHGGCVNSIFGGGLHKSHTSVSHIVIHNGEITNVYGGGCQGLIKECDCEFKSFNDEDIKKSPNITDNTIVKINGGKYNLVFGGGLGYSYTKKTNIFVNGESNINYLTVGGANGITTLGKLSIGNKLIKPYVQPTIKIVQGINRGFMDNIEINVVASNLIEKLYCGGEVPFLGSKENPNSNDASGIFKHSVVTVNKIYANIKEISLGGNDYEEIPEENNCVTIIEV